MRLPYFKFILFFTAFGTTAVHGQDVWTLQRCVQFAIEHNISIQQDVLNKRLAKYTVLQSQLAQLPGLNGTNAYGKSFGRSINPTTNQFVDGGYTFLSLTGNANVLLFGWFAQRNTIARNKFSLDAAQADLDQLKDDVSLNVATGFLRAILAKGQIHISEKQVDLSKAQLAQTVSFANAGRLPELNVAQLESQLAGDSSNLITAISNYTAAILDLKTLLNLDFAAPFEIEAPDVKVSDEMNVISTRPDEIYQEAHKHFGSIKGSQDRVAAAEKGVALYKGNLYPQLSLSGQAGTNWASNYVSPQVTTQVIGSQPIGTTANGDIVSRPVYNILTPVIPFGNQFNNNFRQTVSLNLNLPVFNGWQSQYAVRQARINLATQQLNEYNAELTLKQNVYKAHNDATSSIQKYYAAQRAADAAQRALDFAKKRYDLGLTTTVDFLVTQNSEYTAASNLLSARYDLIFKLKVIDYYLGKELKL
jgi:outer membrane protein